MSGGLSWAYEQEEQEYNEKIKAKFAALTPYEAGTAYGFLLKLRDETMTRNGHEKLDYILSVLK